MKSLLYSTAFILIATMFCLIVPSVTGQTQDNYFNDAEGWSAYYKQHPELTDPPSHEYKNYLRWRAFWDSRAQCMDTSLMGKQQLISSIQNQYAADIDYYNRSTIIASNWKPLGPVNLEYQTNGLVQSVYVDTVSDKSEKTIYIGSNSGGIWKTVDGGLNWQNVTDRSFLPCIGIWDIQGDPTNGSILYAGTGGNFMGRAQGYGLGIIRTQDAGYTWEVIYPLPETQLTQVYKLAIDPSNPSRIYAAIGSKLVRLEKNGANWDTATIFTVPRDSNYAANEHEMIRDIEFVPGRPDTLYIATDHFHWNTLHTAEIWRLDSVSSTPTAHQLNWNLPDTNTREAQRFEIAVTKFNPNSVYVIGDYYKDTTIINGPDTTVERKFYMAINKSIDFGASWTKKYDAENNHSGAANGGVNYFRMELLIDPGDTNKIYVGGLSVSRLEDWVETETTDQSDAGENGYHTDTRDLIILNNGHLYAGNDGGISLSENRIDSWTDINGNGLFLTQYWDMGASDSLPTWIGGGTQDNRFSWFANNQWQNSGTGDRANMIVHYESATDFYIYSAVFPIVNKPIVSISKDGGATWDFYFHIPSGHFNPPLMKNPLRARTVLIGGHHLYKSYRPDTVTHGIIRVNINGDTSVINQDEYIRDMDMATTDSNTLYVAFHWRSSDT
ncbi:MAG: hypothetical protein ISS17_09105 [Bacteroidales bacterium]|nr:hypothetical protein [Bacteroidales bacterium]